MKLYESDCTIEVEYYNPESRDAVYSIIARLIEYIESVSGCEFGLQ